MNPKFFKDSNTIGVIISRMQVPYLTDSHVNLIKTIQARHNKMVILLGVCEAINIKNPFSFDFRKQMINEHLRPHDIIIPLQDNADNKKWVEMVDLMVESSLYKDETAILYGGRDSFIPYYKQDNGKFETTELLPEDNDSGTELRNLASIKLPVYSREVAEAIIYTINKVLS